MTKKEQDIFVNWLVNNSRESELLIQVRSPRNGARGFIVNFYQGKKHIAWHHVATGSVVELGKVLHEYLKRESLPIKRCIKFD